MVRWGDPVCRILLLFTLTSCVCGASLPHNAALNYKAEENGSVTVEWSFSSEADISVASLKIHCLLLPELKVFYHLDNSVEEAQHEQFAGRVRCDRDALGAGRVRLHLARVRTEDSGLYLCRMATGFGKKVKEFSLNITAAVEEPTPATPEPAPSRESRGRVGLYVGLSLAAAAAAAALAACRCVASRAALSCT